MNGRFRTSVEKGVRPVGNALTRTRLSADHLTALGLVLAVPAALAIASGRLVVGLLLLIASAVPDLLDGALAKAKGTASLRGAFFDSVADRVTDALILGGIGWYLQSTRHGHAAMLPFAILATSMLISYQRAKAESLGWSAKGGLMERAERIILLCVGLAFRVVLVPVLWAMLSLTALTAIQRFIRVWRQASRPSAAEPISGPPISGPVAMAERWRAWRAANGWGGETSARDRRYARGTRRGERWRDRRRARLEHLDREEPADAGAIGTPWRWRSDSRRP
ncbi:MAG TPA: CDP-alcohol phosphatidyltransferase family protein [Acidimicrobiales bacterium]